MQIKYQKNVKILDVRWDIWDIGHFKITHETNTMDSKKVYMMKEVLWSELYFSKTLDFHISPVLGDIYDAMLTGRHKELQIWILKVWTIVLLNLGRNTYASTLVKFVITGSHWHSWKLEKCFLVLPPWSLRCFGKGVKLKT